jgi:hypothetical protein
MSSACRARGIGLAVWLCILGVGCPKDRLPQAELSGGSHELLLFFDPTVYQVGEDTLAERTITELRTFISQAPLPARISLHILGPELMAPGRDFILPYSGLVNADTLRLKDAVADTIASSMRRAWQYAHSNEDSKTRRSCILSSLVIAAQKAPSTASARGKMRMLLVSDLLERCKHLGEADLEKSLKDTSKIQLQLLRSKPLSNIQRLYVMRIAHPALNAVEPSQAIEQYWRFVLSQVNMNPSRYEFRLDPPSSSFWTDSVISY